MNNFCKFVSAAGIALGIQGCSSLNQASTDVSQDTINILSSLKDAPIPSGQVNMCEERLTPENAVLCHPQYNTHEIVIDSPFLRGIADMSKSISNEYITPETDDFIYEQEEFWTFPLKNNEGKMSGDCEDHVIFHINTLTSQGIPSFALRPIMVRDTNNRGHLILAIMTNTGMYILDNLHSRNIFAKDIADLERKTGYTTIQMIGNIGPFDWKEIRSLKKKS